ncbi:MAG: 23S rRNA (uracil(1939)-C(5))-methyltransferase RlmD [Cytophagales bacterium]|nr:23S rRNA (uracil(1939)-C(5))-methyltransferase RlmD [Cytophagales bacterium]
MRKRKKIILENLRIERVAAGGKCIARGEDNRVVFVDKTVPGDVVDVRVVKKKKNFYEATPIKFHHYSEIRTEAKCEHFGICGGCKWQNLPYTEQLKYKTQEVADQMQRIGKLDIPEVSPIIGSDKTEYYRNKLEFTFSALRWLTVEEIESGEEQDPRGLGFHIPGQYNKVINVEHCYLQPGPSNEIRNAVLDYAKQQGLDFFDFRKDKGWLRNLIIRTASSGQLMVIVQVYAYEEEPLFALLDFLKEKFPQITSLQYIINNTGNDAYSRLEVHCYHGKPYIEEPMEDLTFRVGPKSFYQPNPQQAYELYKKAREFAQLTGKETVYDLYTGTGTIANFVARQAKQVIGIEYVPEAIEDAKINSQINGISNTKFFAGDMKDMLTDAFVTEHGKADVVITDPPRAGMDPKVVDMLLKVSPERIVYVSCNPATQARDVALLDEMYKVKHIQPVDQFPHTHHIENVVLLEKRK